MAQYTRWWVVLNPVHFFDLSNKDETMITCPWCGTNYQTFQSDCPKCGGPMWDNREGKKNPKAPDFKCKDKGCDGAIWPAKAPTAVNGVPF